MSRVLTVNVQQAKLKCRKLFLAEDSVEYELENIQVRDCEFTTSEELKINRRNGSEFTFENVKSLS